MTLRWLNPALSTADQGQERATGPTISSSGSAICRGHVVRQPDWATALKPGGCRYCKRPSARSADRGPAPLTTSTTRRNTQNAR